MDRAANYHQWILDIFEPYLGPRVIEVGAGIGTFASKILRIARIQELIAVEPAGNLFPILKERLKEHKRARPVQDYLERLAPTDAADSLVAVNVMEHIEDDAAFLRSAHGALRPGGTLLLFVPALPRIYGATDKAIDHYRRYMKSDLSARLRSAGFTIELLRYMNFPGIFGWFFYARMLRRDILPVSSIEFYDRFVIPVVRRIETIAAPPVGQNLIAVARKPAC